MLESALTHPHPTTELWRATCTKVLRSNQKQERLIGALLTLALSQQGLDHHDHFDLAPVVAEIARSHEHEANAKGVTMEKTLSHAQVSGDVRLVERLASNLVDNAIRHNVLGGRLEIVVDIQDGQSSLRVSNTGQLVPTDQVERLLRPFERLDGGRRGGRRTRPRPVDRGCHRGVRTEQR